MKFVNVFFMLQKLLHERITQKFKHQDYADDPTLCGVEVDNSEKPIILKKCKTRLTELSEDVLLLILSYLDEQSLNVVSVVNSTFYSACISDTLWEPLTKRRFGRKVNMVLSEYDVAWKSTYKYYLIKRK